MQVKDIMTRDPACCTPDTDLQEVAGLMVEHDCGGIPVVDDRQYEAGGNRDRSRHLLPDRGRR